MSYRFKFNKVGGQVCCQGDDWSALCPNCKVKASAQEKALREDNARRNMLLEMARNRGENQMRIGQGQNQTPAPAGCRCGKCGGVKPANPARASIIARLSALPDFAGWRLGEMSDSALAELDRTHPAQASAPAPVVRAAAQAPAPAPAASPLRAATIARLAPRFAGRDLNSMSDETLAILDSMNPSAPAPVVSAAPAPVMSASQAIATCEGVFSDPHASFASRALAYQILEKAGKVTSRELPDTMGVKAAEAKRAEESRSEEAKRLEEQRIASENSGWGKVNAMLEAAQKEANKNRAAYEAVEQARESSRSNPNPNLRPLPDPYGLKKLGIKL